MEGLLDTFEETLEQIRFLVERKLPESSYASIKSSASDSVLPATESQLDKEIVKIREYVEQGNEHRHLDNTVMTAKVRLDLILPELLGAN